MISRSAVKWEKIATCLSFDESRIKESRGDVRTVFSMWLDAEGLREPKTWATVVDVLKEAELGDLSDELNSSLSD